MLYDGARRFLRQANVAMREGQVERAHNTLRRAELIIAHLDGILDFEQGRSRRSPTCDLPVLPCPSQRRAQQPGSRQAGRGQRAARRAARGLGPGSRGDRPRVSTLAGTGEQATLRPYEAIHEHAELELELVGRGEIERLVALGERWEQLTRDLPVSPPTEAAPLLQPSPADPRAHPYRADSPARVAVGRDRRQRACEARGRRLRGAASRRPRLDRSA